MNRVFTILVALTVVGSIARAQDVKALVRDLAGGRGRAHNAFETLRGLPAEAVTAEIRRGVKDAEFNLPQARSGVYEFLADVVNARRREGKVVERAYLEMLRDGLADPNQGFRRSAVDTLACVEPTAQKEVAAWITPLLEDPALYVVHAVADALRRFESRAQESLPALLKLLKDPDDATLKRWAGRANEPTELFGRKYGTEDRVLVARTRAAVARLAIMPAWTDLELYPKLDEKGRIAAATAIVLSGERLPSRLAGDPPRARQAIAFVGTLLGNPEVSRDLQLAPLMIWAVMFARLEGEAMNDVRAEALVRIAEAAQHEDERVSKAATGLLESMSKAK